MTRREKSERETAEGRGYAIASLIVGIASLIPCFWMCGGLFGVIAVILGAVFLKGMKQGKYPQEAKNMAQVGIVLGIIGILLGIGGWFVFNIIQTILRICGELLGD